jgi:hypothetical protein
MKIAALSTVSAPTWVQTTTLGRAYFTKFHFYVPAGGTFAFTDIWSAWHTGGGLTAQLLLNASGQLDLRDAGFTQVALSSALARASWHVIEVKEIVAASGVGTLELKLNQSVIGGSTSCSTGTTALAQFRLGSSSGTALQVDRYYSSVIINDDQGASQNTYPGDQRVALILPAGDVAAGGWTKPAAQRAPCTTRSTTYRPRASRIPPSAADASKQIRDPAGPAQPRGARPAPTTPPSPTT